MHRDLGCRWGGPPRWLFAPCVSFEKPQESRYGFHVRSEAQRCGGISGGKLRRTTPENCAGIATFVDKMNRLADPVTLVFDDAPHDARDSSNQRRLAVVDVQSSQLCLVENMGFEDAA